MLNNRTRATEDDFTRRYSLHDLESESNVDAYATRRPTDAGSEIVDLLSPSPVRSCTTRRPTDVRSVIINLSSPSPVPSRNVSRFQQLMAMQPDPLLDTESERNADGNTAIPCHPTGATIAQSEIIDLSSPSPMCNRNVSRNVEMNYQHSNVLNLSDSETERSPEHEKKARDLRLFLARIRDDIP